MARRLRRPGNLRLLCGVAVLQTQVTDVRKLYLDTAYGQMHVRHTVRPMPSTGGHALPCFLLLHWTPFSGRMYEPLAAALARSGIGCIAPDLLGYGRSDPRPTDWTIADWADTLLAIFDHFNLDRAVVLGGHNGASVATEFALNHGELVSHLVLDGCAILTPELRAAFARLTSTPRPTPQADGSHRTLAWDRVERLWQEYMPDFTLDAQSIEKIWPAMIDYLETDFVSSASASGSYALDERLPLLQHPTLILGAEKDTLAGTFPAACDLVPHARSHMFRGTHPLHFAERATEYASLLLDFVRADA